MTSPAFQFYPQDFLVGTADMLPEEAGAYIRLLCYQWVKGGIPTDQRKLMQLTGITDSNLLGNVLVKFRLSTSNDNLMVNDRLEAVRAEQIAYKEKQSQNGSKGGNPNFKKGERNPYYKPKDNPEDNPPIKLEINPSSSPSIDNNINILFIEFWNSYGKKEGSKKRCETKWGKLKPAEREYIMQGVQHYAGSFKDKQFQPYPETFLNGKYWENEGYGGKSTKKIIGYSDIFENELVDGSFQQVKKGELPIYEGDTIPFNFRRIA